MTADDVIDRCAYMRVGENCPIRSSRDKPRSACRRGPARRSSPVSLRDAFSIWLNQHAESGERIAEIAINRAQRTIKSSAKAVVRKKAGGAGPALTRQTGGLRFSGSERDGTVFSRGRFRGRIGHVRRETKIPRRYCRCAAKSSIPGKSTSQSGVWASQEVHDISVALGVDPGSSDVSEVALRQDLHSGRCGF